MELFFAENFTPDQDQILLKPEESRHITKVLRRKSGDLLILTDGRGHHIEAVIEKKEQKQLSLKVRNLEQILYPVENHIEVGIGIIRPNRMDWAVEKLTELGVKKIVPLISRFGNYHKIKTEHLRRISISAIKQSEQYYLPEITSPVTFQDWIRKLEPDLSFRYLGHRNTSDSSSFAIIDSPPLPSCLAIGPEGGFDTEELHAAENHGFIRLNLGKTILRTETAAVVGVAYLKSLM